MSKFDKDNAKRLYSSNFGAELMAVRIQTWDKKIYSTARVIWPSLIGMSQINRTIILDTTPHHWWPMLNCPFNSHPDFMQSCLIQTLTQTALHSYPMLNCPFNSNPDFVQSWLILFSPILHIYVKNFTPTWPIPVHHDPTMNFLLDQGSFCGAIDCPNFGLPMGFKARVVLSLASCIITCHLCC